MVEPKSPSAPISLMMARSKGSAQSKTAMLASAAFLVCVLLMAAPSFRPAELTDGILYQAVMMAAKECALQRRSQGGFDESRPSVEATRGRRPPGARRRDRRRQVLLDVSGAGAHHAGPASPRPRRPYGGARRERARGDGLGSANANREKLRGGAEDGAD